VKNPALDPLPVNEAEVQAESFEVAFESVSVPVPVFTAGHPLDSGTPDNSKTQEDGGRKDGSSCINPGLRPWVFTRKGKAWRRRPGN
jgi:hypothetical protein